MNYDDLRDLGSQTARGGFRNEDDVVAKFNNWQKDEDAQKWLLIMKYNLDEIEYVKAYKITREKTDYDVYLDDSPTNLRKFVEEKKAVVRMIRPWNEPIDGLAWSVNNLTEFIDFLNF